MNPVSFTSIDGAAATASVNGSAIPAANMKRVSFVATLAGATTPEVSVILQGSNDVPTTGNLESTFAPTNWDTVRAITGTVTASFTEDGTLASPAIDVSHRFIRARFVYTSGTGGTITVRLHGQG